MKVVILAGGIGSRLAEETEVKPKPMVEIGGRPILWHIMKHYAHYGLNEFFIALAYTGGRVKRLEPWLKDATFMATYGDGVSNLNLNELLKFHHSHGRVATITAVRPPARFGGLIFDGDLVSEFTEKPQIGEGWINGGFLVFEPGVFDYLEGDESSLEADAMDRLAADKQ